MDVLVLQISLHLHQAANFQNLQGVARPGLSYPMGVLQACSLIHLRNFLTNAGESRVGNQPGDQGGCIHLWRTASWGLEPACREPAVWLGLHCVCWWQVAWRQTPACKLPACQR